MRRYMVMISFIIALSGNIFTEVSYSQQIPARELDALSNLQHEFTVCFAYYSLTKQCIENRNKLEDAAFIEQTSKVIDRLLRYSFETGISIGMTQDAMSSRQKLELDSMMSLIKKSCVNISSLLTRYANRCKVVTENPDSIFEEYLSKR